MSFDINPLGHTFHLQQLEREVSNLKAIQGASGDSETKAAASVFDRLLRLSQALKILRLRPAA